MRHYIFAVGMKHGLDGHFARLAAVELERRQEVYLFHCADMPAGKQRLASFTEGLDSHNPRKHGRAIDLVIVQEGLDGRIQRRLYDKAVVNSHSCDRAYHRTLRWQVLTGSLHRLYIESAGRIPLA